MTQPKLRFLGVVAHPHDFTHFAGTLGIHTAIGDSATVVAMTAGVRTHNEKLSTELMKPVAEQDPEIINQSEDDRAAEQSMSCGEPAHSSASPMCEYWDILISPSCWSVTPKRSMS